MRKIWVFVLAGIAAIALAIFLYRQGGSKGTDPKLAPSSKEVGLYDVKVTITQEQAGQVPATLISIEGEIEQIPQEREVVTRWTHISAMTYGGKAAEAVAIKALTAQAFVSAPAQAGDYEHFIGADFPREFLPLQTNLLQKMFVPLGLEPDRPVMRTEQDEMGHHKVEYRFSRDGESALLDKIWVRYLSEGIKIDAVDNVLHYRLGPDGRLISVQGLLTLHYLQGKPIQFTSDIQITLKKAEPIKVGTKALRKEDLVKADARRVAQVVSEVQNTENLSQDQALAALDKISEGTDSTEVYKIFSALKADLIRSPEHAGVLFEKIRSSKERSSDIQRRLTVVFGALAQSQSPEIARGLVELAKECPDNFCRVQSLVAVNDHPNPEPQNAEALMEIARTSRDEEIASTALLAAGSVGQKTSESLPELPEQLLRELNDPAKERLKTAVIAAMGNHGSTAYFKVLESQLAAEDTGVQAAAAYSMRYIDAPEVNSTLIGLVQKSRDPIVVTEALKAMEYRNLSREEAQTLASHAGQIADRDLQQGVARAILSSYRANPEAIHEAITQLKAAVKDPDVRTYIENESTPKASPTQP